MAKSPTTRKKKPAPTPDSKMPDGKALVTVAVIQFFTKLVERFGWPGTVIILLVMFIERDGSDQQKQAIIDMYILGKGMVGWWPLVVPSVLFLFVIWAQWEVNRKKVKTIRRELNRVSSERSSLQERISGGPLQHGPKGDG
jgi:hypothetical protein